MPSTDSSSRVRLPAAVQTNRFDPEQERQSPGTEASSRTGAPPRPRPVIARHRATLNR